MLRHSSLGGAWGWNASRKSEKLGATHPISMFQLGGHEHRTLQSRLSLFLGIRLGADIPRKWYGVLRPLVSGF